MKAVTITRFRSKVSHALSRKDINTIRQHPGIVAAARGLVRTCRKVIKRIEVIADHASRRKRRTAYRKIVAPREEAIAKSELPPR